MDIEILNEDRLHYWSKRAGVAPEATAELAGIARQVKDDSTLLPIFAAFHEATALRGEWRREWLPLPFDPTVQSVFGERASLFYVLAYMAALPYAEKEYLRRGIGAEVFDATMSDFGLWLFYVYERTGRWGFDRFMWIWRHLTGELFRLGRLQYVLADFEFGVAAFRHKITRQVLLMTDPEVKLRADGYALGAGQVHLNDDQPVEADPPSAETWQATFTENDGGWRGNPVTPYGNVVKPQVFLPRPEWECLLRRGDPVLDVHIPRYAPLTVEACRDSLRQAFDFFHTQYPQRPFKATFCHTWFFTPQLQQILPPESNIVRFQREFYLFPHPGGPGFLWSFVFSETKFDPAKAPRDTLLRRAVLDWLKAGKELFDLPGVLFHSPEEWGSQPYMGAWDVEKSKSLNTKAQREER
jgi:hypothetical protein